jgi:hypothetical protein
MPNRKRVCDVTLRLIIDPDKYDYPSDWKWHDLIDCDPKDILFIKTKSVPWGKRLDEPEPK